MSTLWTFRYHLICNADDRDRINAMMPNAPRPASDADIATISIPLCPAGSPDGTAATMWATNCPATLLMVEWLVTQETEMLKNGAVFYLLNPLTAAYDGLLHAGNSPTAQGSMGQPWSWEQSLADAGYQAVVEVRG